MITPRILRAAVVTHPTLFGGLRIDVGHVLLMLATVFVGGAAGYVKSEPTMTLITALGAWSTAKPIVIGAALAGVLALANLVKQSPVAPNPTATTASDVVPPPPPPPLAIVCMAVLCGACAVFLSACAQLNAAFPQLDKVENVVAKDLESNASDAQIASDVCSVLGGSSTTDAICAGAATLVADTIALLEDGHVLSAAAQTRAAAARPRFLALAGRPQ